LLLLLLMYLPTSPAYGAVDDGAQIIGAQDLAADAAIARGQGLALLVAVTRHGCPYCRVLKRDILVPMARSGGYSEQVLIRELVIDPESPVVDFDGREVSSADIARRYDVGITPTVLLLDSLGNPLHAPLVGINTPEMYGYYLDRAIEAGRSKLAAGRSAGPAREN
jgi:thioredoxin-related protein